MRCSNAGRGPTASRPDWSNYRLRGRLYDTATCNQPARTVSRSRASFTVNTLWGALLLAGPYLAIHLVEGETITPMLLARRFTLNPVVVIFGIGCGVSPARSWPCRCLRSSRSSAIGSRYWALSVTFSRDDQLPHFDRPEPDEDCCGVEVPPDLRPNNRRSGPRIALP